jgi:TonB family protein
MLVGGFSARQGLPPVSAATDYAHLSKSVTQPRLVHSVDPEYTADAVAWRVEGTVVLEAVVGLNGRVTNASVLVPLPAGLSEKALEAVKRWQYVPASMDTVDIPVLTPIDVVFRLPYAKNPAAPRPMPSDIQQAAYLGDVSADVKIGDRCEREHNFSEAKRYFRLCAAVGNANCEYRLGKLMVSGPDVNPNDFAQGVAWLEIAKDRRDKQASVLCDTEAAKLSSIQQDWVAQLKPRLERSPYR